MNDPCPHVMLCDESQSDYLIQYLNISAEPPPTPPVIPPCDMPMKTKTPSPAVGSIGIGLNPVLTWVNGGGATSYRVFINGTLVATVTNPTYTPAPLGYSTTYTWRVDAVNDCGATPGDDWTFTTIAALTPPVKAVMISPTNGQIAVSTSPTLVWANGGGATSFNVYAYLTGSLPTLVGSQAGTTCQLTGLENIKNYSWRIDSINASGTTQGDVWTFTTIASIPINTAVPVITGTPKVGETLSSTNGSWTNNPGSYAFRWMSNGVVIAGATANTFDVTSAQVGARIKVQVQATNPFGPSQWATSLETAAVLPSAPGKASNPTPGNGASGVATALTLTWYPGAWATSYNVWFNGSLVASGGSSNTFVVPGILVNGQTYPWRVDSVNAGGITQGDPWTFTTIVAPPGQASTPTPANGAVDVAINLTLSWAAAAGATLYDVIVNGSLVASVSGTSYTPAAFGYFSVITWQVNAKNVGGVTTGPTWSFRTLAAPPNKAVLVSPGMNAINVFIPGNLTWANGGGATTYDVYLVIDGQPWGSPVSGAQAGTTHHFQYPQVVGDTRYAWRIDSRNATGVTQGDTWYFNTAHY